MAQRGRGHIAKIDLAELEKLSSIQATDEELAAWFNVSRQTIERRKKNPKFLEAMNRGRAHGRMSVRRKQMQMLLDESNPTMAVWLGKQLLGQRDRQDIDHSGEILIKRVVGISDGDV